MTGYTNTAIKSMFLVSGDFGTHDEATSWAREHDFSDDEVVDQTLDRVRSLGLVDGTIGVWHCRDGYYLFTDERPCALDMLREHMVTADNLEEWTDLALEIDWDAAYEATKDDGEITDETCEIGDLACAVYWYAVHCHAGQWTREYRLQCAVGKLYRPGASETGPESETAEHDVYLMLVEAAGCTPDA